MCVDRRFAYVPSPQSDLSSSIPLNPHLPQKQSEFGNHAAPTVQGDVGRGAQLSFKVKFASHEES